MQENMTRASTQHRATLVVGSAPDLPEWWQQHNSKIQHWCICPINNAWKIVGHKLTNTWFHSSDFFVLAQVKPEGDELTLMLQKACQNFLHWPFCYDKGGCSGTMLLNVLYHMLNVHLQVNDLSPVYVVASDMVYNRVGNTHWYGSSSADPLRNGEKWIDNELKRVRDIYGFFKKPLVNLSEQEETRLPFERMVL